MSAGPAAGPNTLLEVEGLTKHFPVTEGVFGRVVAQVRAVDDVSFTIDRGETLGLVGESGSGKTTVGRSILRLIEPTRGRVLFDGTDVVRASTRELRALRRKMQIVFQDPYGSLNPRMRVIDIVGEAMERHGLLRGVSVERRVAELLQRVGLSPAWINRYPHEFSGGQRQRIGVARAIALEPKLIVCDEPVSALDVSVQAQVVNLLKELGRELDLSYLFIAHDLSVVRHISDRVAVMYLGEIVEVSSSKRLFEKPGHPYTRALLSAIPVPEPRRERRRLVLSGDIPSPLNPPSGCRFHTRCPAVFERCSGEVPKLVDVGLGQTIRCFHAYDLKGADWYAELDARIEERIAKNLRSQTVRPALRKDILLGEPEGTLVAEPLHRSASQTALAQAGVAKTGPGRRTWLLLGGGLLLIFAFLTARQASREREARRMLQELTLAIEARKAITGAYPGSLSELGFRLPPIFRGGAQLDPWARPFVYQPPPDSERSFELLSLGPDGVPSRDDIHATPRD